MSPVLNVEVKNLAYASALVLLMLAGQAAYSAANYSKAISHWETVLTVLAPDSPDATQVKAEIADALAKLAKK